MGTQVPERITIPNRVDTRLGPLTFFDGFPDDETVDRLYDNLDFPARRAGISDGHPGGIPLGHARGSSHHWCCRRLAGG